MSLFLGNLSSHIRRDELERVFRRFGRSNVQLKDGYGFVIYDFPANAEKALKALRGRNICGEPISLTWANKQPRPFQRFAKGTRFYEPQNGTNFARGRDYAMRKMGLHDQREYKMATKQLDSDGGRPNLADMLDKETSYHHDDLEDQVGEKHHNSKEGLPDEGGTIEPNTADNDRWGESVGNPFNDNGVENGTDFDRYEPYHGCKKGDEDENHQITTYVSPSRRGSQEKAWRQRTREATLKHPDNPMSQQTCYICGLMGHKMRNCPRADATRQEKFSRHDRRQDDEISIRGRGKGELKRLRSTSWGRLNSSGDPLLPIHMNDRNVTGSGKPRKPVRRRRSSPTSKESQRAQIRRDYRGKKRSRREHGTPKKNRGKKARLGLPLHRSDSTESRSCSVSSKSVSGISFRSRSRSVSSRTRSVSSSSSSTSTSSYSRSESSRNRSRSPTSLSLSISLGGPLPSSPDKLQMKATGTSPKGFFNKITIPVSENLLVEQSQLVESYESSENSKLKNTSVIVKDENVLSSFKVEGDVNKQHPGQPDDDGNQTMFSIACNIKHPCTTQLDEGAITARSLSPENLRDRRDIQKSGTLVVGHKQSPIERPDPELPVRTRISNSTSISSQEMCMVLKHYGMALPEENEKQLPVEAYFGSARLWPWEIIYYRRLKKGPISTENYARRIAQNREFGIVDKYIRSSSGWEEFDQNSP